ncbi:Toll/interleukin-1 receptor domain-containing protein [Tanacetum coccineum]
MMKRRMCGRKVIVLDDVDHINQLEALAGEPCWYKPGSRVIITTRDEQVLVAHGVSLIRDVNLLSHGEALCLFSRYAFGRGIPIQGYTELSRMVVRYASGLPLTIRVLGWPKDAAIRVLESCKFHARNALRVLEQKSLITITHNEYLGMHDHIEEMGKNIVHRLHPNKPCKHSRLWIEKEIKDVLVNDLGTEATRCIKLSMSNLTPLIVMKGLGNMKELRYLDVGSGGHDPPFGFLKHGHASQYLSLSRCYGKFDEKLPEELGRLECLKELNIAGTSIVHLPRSIYQLKALHSGLNGGVSTADFSIKSNFVFDKRGEVFMRLEMIMLQTYSGLHKCVLKWDEIIKHQHI